ncbi:uncharacterized protein LOC117243136 isoform X1 [Bombus vosnesenskii]|uniref:Uncharacterized protein LOC117243136 isoform X1 n=1 Tax=Bombus vosnesenskii TaxID=207650 RepID=A0A6J3LL82_9HYME|nr:uncharacterized protein LOC117243136 isoform X1 [Bombus vosnesenskii]XP_033366264.1 uncharacterized protein LOC117243136 isoform X1 [Bombus vosnesenskii]
MTGTTDVFVPGRFPEGNGLGRVVSLLQRTAYRLCNAKFRRQWLACFSATLTMVIVGTVYGWTTASLLHLTSGTGGVPLTLTPDESSWIVSLTVLGSMFGSLVGAKLADLIGRKYCLLSCCTIFILGWLNVYTAISVPNLYLARVILGVGVGIAYTVNPMYVSEIADINIRGALGTLIAVNVFSGSLLTCILGNWLTYRSLAIALVILSCVSFLSNTCFPETPYFLVAKRRKKQACKSITYYRSIVDPREVKVALRALQPQITCKLQPRSRSDFTLSSGSGYAFISLRELPTDSNREVVDTEPRSDLNLPSSSDSQSQSISVTHSAVICNLQPQTTGELPLQPPCEFHPQPTSELHLPPNSKVHPSSTSEVHPPYTSEIQPEPTSKIQPKPTSEIQPEPTSETHPEPTSEIQPKTTSEIHQPSTGEIQPEPTSETHPEPTSEIQPKIKSEILQPSTGEIHPETTSKIHQPSTSKIHQPSTSKIHQPSTSKIHQPSISKIHQPSTSKIHQPSTSEIHKPSTSEIHRPSTSESRSGATGPSQSSVNFPSPCSCESCTLSTVESIWSNEPYVDVTKETWLTRLRVILQPNNRKALFIMLGLIMAQQLGGNFITMQYLGVLFSKTTIGIEPKVATILVLTVGLISSTLSTITVESVGRRTLLILSTLGSCFTLMILAIYLTLDQYKFDVSNVSTLPVIDLIIYQVMFQIGLGTLPNVFLCELFPTELKGIVGAIIVIFDGIIGFIVSKLYQVITDNAGSCAVYFIFSTSCCLAFLMVFVWVPETKGKTYREIEALLVGKNLNSLNEGVRTNETDIRRV